MKELSWISPSSAERLLSCGLQVAYRIENSGEGGERSTLMPAALLGEVCHAVLEEVARGGLASSSKESFKNDYDQLWNRAITEYVPNGSQPERWRGYAKLKIGTRLIAAEITAELVGGAELFPELALKSADGKFGGRADLVVRSPTHEIRDYKTGQVADEDGIPRVDYVRQLKLYAALEWEVENECPTAIVLIEVAGARRRFEIPIVTADLVAVRQEVDAAVARFNEMAVIGGSPLDLADPSAGTCRYCAFSAECPAFWEAEATWDDPPYAAIAGEIVNLTRVLEGGVSIEVSVERGTLAGNSVTVSPLELTEIHNGGGAVVGAGFVGVNLINDRPEFARLGAASRVGISTP